MRLMRWLLHMGRHDSDTLLSLLIRAQKRHEEDTSLSAAFRAGVKIGRKYPEVADSYLGFKTEEYNI